MKRLSDIVTSVYAAQDLAPPCAKLPPFRPYPPSTANSADESVPLLRPHAINRILIYPGCFNPPHQGHLDLLLHTFTNAGEDFNLVAAIVLPLDDDLVTRKSEPSQPFLHLSKSQRCELLREGLPQESWLWVFEGGTAEWEKFRAGCEEIVKADESIRDLKFVLLGGPEYFSVQKNFTGEGWRCTEAITSDVSRPVSFRSPSMLWPLPGYTAWEGVRYDFVRLERSIRGTMRGKPKQIVDEEVRLAITRIRAVAVCRSKLVKPRVMIRFVPADTDSQSATPPSSTEIRKVISLCSDDALEETLARAGALASGTLAKYILKLRHGGSKVTRERNDSGL